MWPLEMSTYDDDDDETVGCVVRSAYICHFLGRFSLLYYYITKLKIITVHIHKF